MADGEGPGSGFWWKVIGGVVVFGLAAFILLILLTKAVYAWGVLGAFVGVIVVLLGFAWFYDRRNAQRRSGA